MMNLALVKSANFCKRLKNIVLLMFMAMAIVNVSACGTQEEAPVIPQVNAPVTASEKVKLYKYLLSERGIEVVKIGETLTIFVDTDPLFVPGSANLETQYAKNLKVVARLINSYDTTSVAVTFIPIKRAKWRKL